MTKKILNLNGKIYNLAVLAYSTNVIGCNELINPLEMVCLYVCINHTTTISNEEHFFQDLLQNYWKILEDMFPRYYMCSNMFSMFRSATTFLIISSDNIS